MAQAHDDSERALAYLEQAVKLNPSSDAAQNGLLWIKVRATKITTKKKMVPSTYLHPQKEIAPGVASCR
jgi:hypothetical protein